MNTIQQFEKPSGNRFVLFDPPLEKLERAFNENLTKSNQLDNRNTLRSEFLNDESNHSKSFDDKSAVDYFIHAALFFFSALEEADWLCYSAGTSCEEVINDESSWNIYKLLPFENT